MTEDIFNTVIDFGKTTPMRRPAPPGRYLAVLGESHPISNKKTGNEGRAYTVHLESPLDDQDMTDVDVTKERIEYPVWITEKSLSSNAVLNTFLIPVFPEYAEQADKLPLNDLLEQATGRPVIASLALETKDREGNPLKYPRHLVISLESAT